MTHHQSLCMWLSLVSTQECQERCVYYIPPRACSAFSNRDGSRMRRLMRLRLKGSILGTPLLLRLLLLLLLLLFPFSGFAAADAIARGLSLQIEEVVGLFCACTWGATACSGTGMMGAITEANTTISLSLAFPNPSTLNLPSSPHTHTHLPTSSPLNRWQSSQIPRSKLNLRLQRTDHKAHKFHALYLLTLAKNWSHCANIPRRVMSTNQESCKLHLQMVPHNTTFHTQTFSPPPPP